jgi:hypothetical protein
LIILGLGVSTNCAPLIPALTETADKAKTRSIDSINNTITRVIEACAISIPIMLHNKATKHERKTVNVYFDLTRFFALIGEEYKSQIEEPSSPMIIVPNDMDIKVPGRRSIQDRRKGEASSDTV